MKHNTYYFAGDRKTRLAVNKFKSGISLEVYKPKGSSEVDFTLELTTARSCETLEQLLETAKHYMYGVEAGRSEQQEKDDE